MPRPVQIAAVTVLLLAACSGNDGSNAERRTPQPPTLPGVYSGTFPCSNCAAIEATLWLRPDGRFFLRQRFVDDAAGEQNARGADATYGLGRWSWDEVAAEATLQGAGPKRRLMVRDDGKLELGIGAPHEHVLAHDASEPAFGERLMLDGESAVTDAGATFKECLTGLTWPVADTGDYPELRRQHRRINPRGKVALTTVEAHLVTRTHEGKTSERLVVDRFVTLKPGQGC